MIPVEIGGSSDFVTQTSTTITIENDYYKAVFDSDSSHGHGRIRYFYIKPQTTVNIIPTNQWCMFAGHEILTANGTSETDPRDWEVATCENVSTTVVYSSGGVAIVKTDKYWKTLSESKYQLHITSYWTFYEDKPYYIEHHKRVYLEDESFIFNSEVCHFLDDQWVSNYTTIDEDGSILNDTNPSENIAVEETTRLGEYPWVYLYNTTYNLGIGWILLSAEPTDTVLWSYYKSAGNYVEMQVQYGIEGATQGQTAYHTLLTYVTSDYSDVDSLAGSLDSTKETTESFRQTVQLNENKPTTGYSRGDLSVMPNLIHLEPYSDKILNRWHHADKGSNTYVYFQNSTNNYKLYAWSSLTWDDWSWNGSYGTVTFQNEFESKIRLRWTFEFWNDSDAFRQILNFTTMTDVDISALYINFHKVLVSQSVQRLNSSVIKLYDYDSYYESWVEETGVAYQNLTGCATNEALSSDANFYALNQTEATVSSGTTYIMTIKYQRYYRLSSESLGAFDETDILDFGESENDRFHILTWNCFPLLADRDFAIKHYGYGNIIGSTSFQGNVLSFVVAGESGESNTIELYCGGKGSPQTVRTNEVLTSFSYDSSTDILTFSVTYSSVAEVKISWGEGASSSFSLRVHVSKNKFPYMGAIVNVEGENKTTDIFGDAYFDVGVGSCDITVYLEDKVERKEIFISADHEIGFDFDISVPTDRSIYIYISVPIIFIVVLVVIFLWRRE